MTTTTPPKVLDMAVLRSFTVGKQIELPSSTWTGVRFDSSGSTAVGVSSSDTMHTLDLRTGTRTKSVPCRKYGVTVAVAVNTDDGAALLHSSGPAHDHALRLYSLKQKRYLRYFSGHSSDVASLAVGPRNRFVTAAQDGTVRVWDVRSANCQAVLTIPTRELIPSVNLKPSGFDQIKNSPNNNNKIPAATSGTAFTSTTTTTTNNASPPPLAAFDPTGKCLFVVPNHANLLLAYDQSQTHTAPFLTRVLADPQWPPSFDCVFLQMEFATSLPLLLLAVEKHAYVVDTATGTIVYKLSGRDDPVDPSIIHSESNLSAQPDEKPSKKQLDGIATTVKPPTWTWSPSSKYVLSPSTTSSHVLCWYIPPSPPPPPTFSATTKQAPVVQLRPCVALPAHDPDLRMEGVQWHASTPMFCTWAQSKLQLWISNHADLDSQMDDRVF